jgi:hypothetical protein
MSGAIPPLPNKPSLRGAQLKHRDNFTFYLIGKPVVGFCEYKNKPWNYIKDWEFLDQLSDYQLVKGDFGPWSSLRNELNTAKTSWIYLGLHFRQKCVGYEDHQGYLTAMYQLERLQLGRNRQCLYRYLPGGYEENHDNLQSG